MAGITKIQPLLRSGSPVAVARRVCQQTPAVVPQVLQADFSSRAGRNSGRTSGQAGEATPPLTPRRFVPPVVSYEAWNKQRVRVRDLSSPFSPRLLREVDVRGKDVLAERLRELNSSEPPAH